MIKYVILMVGSLIICSDGLAASNGKDIPINDCLQEMLISAPDGMTVGEMRSTCTKKNNPTTQLNAPEKERGGVVNQRVQIDRENILKPFTLMAHNQNYILAAHNFSGYSNEEYDEGYREDGLPLDDSEIQFQLSLKTPVAINLFDSNVDVFAAYTVRSFWQVFNDKTTSTGREMSAPFRETNHEPEIWIQTDPDFEILGFDNVLSSFGYVHQSNGQADSLSRSWNRIFAQFIFQRDNLAISLKPWYRLQENSASDDNPDITDYLGHGEVTLAYKWKEHCFSFMSRNNIESGFSKGAVELGWSFPLWEIPYFKGYVQYFSGYGESLIDYDEYVNRLGVGIILTDLL